MRQFSCKMDCPKSLIEEMYIESRCALEKGKSIYIDDQLLRDLRI